uniref:Uncharacterized protein n=1 Tax=Picea sitchensis TaxID=3332 RepID=A0A6B9XVR2_PICSI|nr:hypothetical protein Q903MT_gene4089 [Picea sitchensis]
MCSSACSRRKEMLAQAETFLFIKAEPDPPSPKPPIFIPPFNRSLCSNNTTSLARSFCSFPFGALVV